MQSNTSFKSGKAYNLCMVVWFMYGCMVILLLDSRTKPPGQNPPDKTPRTIPRWTNPPPPRWTKPPCGQNPPGQNPPDKTPRTKSPGQNPPGKPPPRTNTP